MTVDSARVVYRRRGGPVENHPLSPFVNTIGLAGAVLVFDDADTAPHAEIRIERRRATITDYGSGGGTFLNKVRLSEGLPTELRDGDEIVIGLYIMIYHSAQLPQPQWPVKAAPGPNLARPRYRMRPLSGVSGLLALLPPIYHDAQNDFLRRFLLIPETILQPLSQLLDQVHTTFDPQVAPESFLPWLAGWVGVIFDETVPVERRRLLIAAANELYRLRGTRRGLTLLLTLYTGLTPVIVEAFDDDAAAADLSPHEFLVRVTLPVGTAANEALLRRLIESAKPAHTGFDLDLIYTQEETP